MGSLCWGTWVRKWEDGFNVGSEKGKMGSSSLLWFCYWCSEALAFNPHSQIVVCLCFSTFWFFLFFCVLCLCSSDMHAWVGFRRSEDRFDVCEASEVWFWSEILRILAYTRLLIPLLISRGGRT